MERGLFGELSIQPVTLLTPCVLQYPNLATQLTNIQISFANIYESLVCDLLWQYPGTAGLRITSLLFWKRMWFSWLHHQSVTSSAHWASFAAKCKSSRNQAVQVLGHGPPPIMGSWISSILLVQPWDVSNSHTQRHLNLGTMVHSLSQNTETGLGCSQKKKTEMQQIKK